MQIDRLFEIVHILLNQKNSTTRELAEYFGVTKRTILRDIDTLTLAGIPISTRVGKGGGISILDTYVLNKTYITDDERYQILLGLKTLLPTEINGKGIFSKIDSMFSNVDTSWIEVDFSRWGNSALDREKFDTLKKAVVQKQAIHFSYLSSYGEMTERSVYPLKLVYKGNAWYLQAFCLLKQDSRTFKINRMIDVTMLLETFHAYEYISMLTPIDTATSLSLVDVKAVFSKEVAYRVYEEFSPKDITRNSDGTFTVQTQMPLDNWVCGYFLSYGKDICIIEPQNLREILLKQVEEIKKIYSKR